MTSKSKKPERPETQEISDKKPSPKFINKLMDELYDDPAALLFKQIDYNIDFINRTIIFEEEIDTYTPYFISQRIAAIVHATGDDETPITIEITSYGGDVYGGLAAVDVIRTAPMPINTIARGGVMSAASWILIAGTGTRSMTENSVVMIHEISKLMDGTSKDIFTEAAHMKELQVRVFKLYGDFTKRNAVYWKRNSRVNLYLTAEKCLECGIVDNIIKNKNERIP